MISADFSLDPYPGLRPFRQEETDIFFGREKHTDQLLERLGNHRFLAVTGLSGCGKSSLVRAGLIPALNRGFIAEAGHRWRVVQMRPGRTPFARLAGGLLNAAALASEREGIAGGAEFVEETLRRGPMGLVEVLRQTPPPVDTNLLLVVDQFEEIFRFRMEDEVREAMASEESQQQRQRRIDEADAFVQLLLASKDQVEFSVFVLLTMRTDYLGHCAVFRGLLEVINESQYIPPPVSRDQLIEAICAPAQVFNGRVEETLCHRLLNDADSSQDQLPLLQHALMRMWNLAKEGEAKEPRHNPNVLTVEHYAKVGSIRPSADGDSALSRHGREVLDQLSSEKQCRIAEMLFRALSGGARERRDTRRFVNVQEMAAIAEVETDEIIKVADIFRAPGCNFIAAIAGEGSSGELQPGTELDISHESLIRNWDKLKEWVGIEAESSDDYLWLEQAARRWQMGEGDLFEETNLKAALAWERKERPSNRWAARYGSDFDLAMEFLGESEKRQAERLQAEEQQREREREQEEAKHRQQEEKRLAEERALRAEAEREREKAENERRRRKRERLYALTLVLIGLIAGAGFLYGIFSKGEAEQRALQSERDQLAALSRKMFNHGRDSLQLTSDPRNNVLALRDFSTALRENLGNTDAAKLACQLLYSRDWCLALTPDLRYQTDSSYSILCAATFSPSHMGDTVFAVAENGDLISWSRGDRTAHFVRRLFTNEDREKKNIPLTLTAAFFSEDGQSLLVIPPAAATDIHQPAQPGLESSTGANSAGGVVKAELWRWSSRSDSYDLIQKDITLSGLNSYRVVSWAANGTEFIVISFSRDWNESFCQIFQSQDSTFKEIKDAPFQPPEKKVVAACFDYHNRWIATVSREGFVELWDPKNFSPAIETSGGKVSFSPPSKFRPSLVASGSGKDELTITAFGQSGWILDVGNGRFRELPPLPTPRDQSEVFTFGPEHGNRRLTQAALYRRAVIQNASDAARIEPICFCGVFGTVQFSYDGKQLLTLSGDSRNVLDTIRIWRVPSLDPARSSINVEFTGKDAPAWLADLASVASGAPQLSDDDVDVSSIVDKLSKEGPGDVAKEYKEVWYRFFPEPPEKSLTSF
jgi:hypothetical protein